ncbi:hypothetical protein [Massilia sp. BJB1822]|uniref:hypothetical protein n=1 Tax=Massilia sp. BJB1822 TaxID=2744470 RepID=UPI001594D72D|nr:hypothetical protein [Massilia sp. BJB1822]NVD99957.1 hypothetical protein [Massilia sp. BJB1822]
MTVNVQLLNDVAEKCRLGFLSLQDEVGSMFKDFPQGACGPAAEIVGRIMKEQTGYDGVYVCGSGHPRLRPNQTHAWYEMGNYIIDVTYDQFEDTGLSGWIFVRGTGWHAEFVDLDRRAGFCMPSGWPCYPFDGYQAIKAELTA